MLQRTQKQLVLPSVAKYERDTSQIFLKRQL